MRTSRAAVIVSCRIPTGPKFIDRTGQRVGRWVVEGYAGVSNGRLHYWRCRCECGAVENIYTTNLSAGDTLDCGCSKRKLHDEPLYAVWCAMKQRCTNPNDAGFHRYGGRGITVCERWQASFYNFEEDMGPKPSPKHSVERLDNNGPYSPENCAWRTMKEQCKNKRSNVLVEHNGKKITVKQLSEETGLPYSTLLARANAGQTGNILLRPIMKMRKHALVYNGASHSASSLAKLANMDITTLLHRIDVLGMSVKEAVEWPVDRMSTMTKLVEA